MRRKRINISILLTVVGFSCNLLFSSCSLLEKSSKSIQDKREGYKEVDLQTLSSDTLLVGVNPEEIALKTFGIPQNINSENISQKIMSTNQGSSSDLTILITQMGLPDDSLKGIRYRIDFVPYNNSSSKPQWQIIWVGQQFICQPGRGEQNWTANYCY